MSYKALSVRKLGVKSIECLRKQKVLKAVNVLQSTAISLLRQQKLTLHLSELIYHAAN